ncbi:MAG: helix-turn-helix domain-containing protein [Acidovorax sp.]|nr:helix-turn-helix domain-containing protein [Acidovorax sp.]
MDEVLSIEQVASLLSCEATTVAEHLKNGLLPGLKFGRHWVVPARAFFERINEMAHEQAAMRRDEKKRARTPLAHVIPPSAGGQRRRAPPPLPSLTVPGHI